MSAISNKLVAYGKQLIKYFYSSTTTISEEVWENITIIYDIFACPISVLLGQLPMWEMNHLDTLVNDPRTTRSCINSYEDKVCEWWSQYIISCRYDNLGMVSSTVTRFVFLLLVMLSLSAKWFRIMLTTTSCLTLRLSISIDDYRFATLLQCPTHAAYGTPNEGLPFSPKRRDIFA